MTQSGSLRLLWTIMAGVACLAMSLAFMWMGIAPARVMAVSGSFRLPAAAGLPISLAPGLDEQTLQRALLAAPTRQGIVNVAMVRAASRDPSDRAAGWLKTLGSLGWRDIVSRQNIIADAIRRQDLNVLVDSADALMRQHAIMEQAIQFMTLAEAYPETWPRVFALLKSNVAWRPDYLGNGYSIVAPVILDGRARTIAALRRQGSPLGEEEVRPFVAALVKSGRLDEADQLWRQFKRDNTSAVHDPNFVQRLTEEGRPATPLSFAWTLYNGVGYSAEAASNGLGGAVMRLQWDGRGLPVFLSQQTSAGPGRSVLRVRVDGDLQSFGDRIGFRLQCGNTLTSFERVRQSGRSDLTLATAAPAPCAFPVLQAYGRVQDSARAFDGALTRILMDGPTPRADTGPAAR